MMPLCGVILSRMTASPDKKGPSEAGFAAVLPLSPPPAGKKFPSTAKKFPWKREPQVDGAT